MTWKKQNKSLIKEFEFENFVAVIKFVNKISAIAEKMDHHPDLFIYSYKKLRIKITTHSKNTITKKDRALAKSIDQLTTNPSVTK